MDSEDYLVLSYRTDLGKRVSIRVTSARRDLPPFLIRTIMLSIRDSNILEPVNGNMQSLESAALYQVERMNIV